MGNSFPWERQGVKTNQTTRPSVIRAEDIITLETGHGDGIVALPPAPPINRLHRELQQLAQEVRLVTLQREF